MSEKTAKHQQPAMPPTAVAAEAAEATTLSARDTQAFVQAVLEPQHVGQRLRETVRHYRTMTGVYGAGRLEP